MSRAPLGAEDDDALQYRGETWDCAEAHPSKEKFSDTLHALPWTRQRVVAATESNTRSMKPTDIESLKRAVHMLSETERAAFRTYVLTVFDVRGRDTRVNLLPDERDRSRLR